MKQSFIVLSTLLLGACTVGHETDMDAAAARREMNIEARHEVTGCTFVKDHEAYKNCLLNTYRLNSPATYSTSTLSDGRSVAIIHSNQQMGTSASACGLKPLPNSADKYEWAAPTTASETKTVETVCQKKFEPQQTVIQTVEERVAPPEPEIIFVQQEEQIAPLPPPPPMPPKYVVKEPVCPCEDPNDPCPQCYDK